LGDGSDRVFPSFSVFLAGYEATGGALGRLAGFASSKVIYLANLVDAGAIFAALAFGQVLEATSFGIERFGMTYDPEAVEVLCVHFVCPFSES